MGTQSLTLITEDGVELRWGQIVDGETLIRNGSIVESAPDAVGGSAGPNFGTATLAFGSTPAETASVVVTGQAWVAADSKIQAWFMASSTAGNDAEAHKQAGVFIRLVVGSLVVGTGFTIFAWCTHASADGDFTVCWEGL